MPGPILDMEIAFVELFAGLGIRCIIITHGAWFWGGTKDRACRRNVQSDLGLGLRADFNEKFSFLGTEPSAVKPGCLWGKVESSFALSYHDALHTWSVCTLPTIQSVICGQAGRTLFLLAPLPRHAAAMVFSFLSEL